MIHPQCPHLVAEFIKEHKLENLDWGLTDAPDDETGTCIWIGDEGETLLTLYVGINDECEYYVAIQVAGKAADVLPFVKSPYRATRNTLSDYRERR